MHRLSAGAISKLVHMAENEVAYSLADGEVRLVLDHLPGRAVVGVARQGDRLWIILDLDKPDPYRHLVRLMNTWPLDNEERLAAEASHQRIDDVENLLIPFVRPHHNGAQVIRGNGNGRHYGAG